MSTKAWFEYEGVKIAKIVGAASAYTYTTGHVALDADGSPRAYHPDDTGIDALANAGYPNRGWKSVLVVDPAHPDRPYVQPSGKYAGYFVSKTSLIDKDLAATDPAKYVDSEQIPYIVFPGAFFAVKGTGNWGDLAMVRDPATGAETAAIVADGGPTKAPLGEMSLKLAVALGGHNPNPRNGAGAPRGKFQYVIFPGSRAAKPWRREWSEIDQAARALLAQAGGWP